MDVPDYTRAEERRILNAVQDGGAITCPRCGHPLESRDVPPMRDVAYVRHRLWLHCATCGCGIVVDRPRQ